MSIPSRTSPAPSQRSFPNAGFRPPERVIDVTSGAGPALSSVFGAIPVSLAGFITPIVGGPDAGNRDYRYQAAYIVGIVAVFVAVIAALETDIREVVPASYLQALVGPAPLGVLQQSLAEITRGPLRLGPLIAFVVTRSDLTMFELGPLLWSLVLGIAVTHFWKEESTGNSADPIGHHSQTSSTRKHQADCDHDLTNPERNQTPSRQHRRDSLCPEGWRSSGDRRFDRGPIAVSAVVSESLTVWRRTFQTSDVTKSASKTF